MNYKEAYTKLKIKRFTDIISVPPFFAVMFLLRDDYLRQGFLVNEYVIVAKPFLMTVLYSCAAGFAVSVIGYSIAYFYTCDNA